MNFSSLFQHAQRAAARTFGSTTSATVTAWFPTSANAAPEARSSFSVTVSDVTQGPPRIQRDALSGTVITRAGTIRIMLPVADLSYTPVAAETVCLLGTSRASATLYRVQAVETAAGIYEIELRPEAQALS